MSIQFVQPTFNEFTLNFPEPTETEKQKMILQAAQELAYDSAVKVRTIFNAEIRKARRTRLRRQAAVAGGFTFKTPYIQPFDLDHGYDSKRAERRRTQLGRV